MSDLCGVQFNSFLVRLYFNGKDNIAHHTDGRTFLGEIPTIASLSLGATATFELKRMNNVWPDSGTPGEAFALDFVQVVASLLAGNTIITGVIRLSYRHAF